MRRALVVGGIGLFLTAPIQALDVHVGGGIGCQYATLQEALDAIEGIGGDHYLRINAGNHTAPNGMVYQPTVNQGFVRLEGGYASCLAGSPSGAANSDAGRSIFDASGGFGRSALELQINGRVGSFQIRRVALQGGDALNSAQRFNHGGGLAVYGQASVLLGAGASVRNNAAGFGGGVALVGSRINLNEPLARIDLYLDEDAEIRNNEAAGFGGGVYCGGATGISSDPPSELRHGSLVHRQGAISNNRSGHDGSAVYCRGSYAGGGYQPRPRPGALASLTANSGLPGNLNGGRCTVRGTLDLIVAENANFERVYGAEDGSNGLLLVAGNGGHWFTGLCLDGEWGTRGGASPAPTRIPELAIQNLWFSSNLVEARDAVSFGHTSALTIGPGLHLSLRPSGPGVVCGGAGSSCVQFDANGPAAGMPASVPVNLIHLSGLGAWLSIHGARITGNSAQDALVDATYGDAIFAQFSSIVDNNVVTGTEAVLYRADGLDSQPTTSVLLQHNTLSANQHLRFFKLVENSVLASQGNVLHASSPRLLRFGDAPPGNLRLRYCNYLTTLADAGYTGATHIDDGFGALVSVTGALSFGANFTPPLALIDQCRTPQLSTPPGPQPDFGGLLFGFPFAPANPNRTADIGAIEYRPAGVFANGFETPSP